MRIEIIKWNDYNPRKDLKSTSWFRVQNTFWQDHKFFELTNDGKMVWIALLSTASQEQESTIDINPGLVAAILRMKTEDVILAIEILQELQCVHVLDTQTLRGRDVDVPLQNRTEHNEQNKTEQKNSSTSQKRGRFNATSLLDALNSLPQSTIDHWVEMYPDKAFRDRTLKKCFHYYDQQHPRKKPKTVQGWSGKFGYWLDKDWGKSVAKPKTFAQMRSDNNADLYRRAQEGEFDEYEN